MMWNYGYGPMMGWNQGWGFGIIGIVINVVFWLLIAWAIVAIVKYLGHSARRDEDNSMEILKERYAKGEITKKEFEEMKKDLA